MLTLFAKATGLLIISLLLLALFGRFVFGNKSVLCRAVFSAIGILFIYALTVVLIGTDSKFQQFLTPLPFVTISGDSMELFSFQADYFVICSELLNMIMLSFLMNFIDSLLPIGTHIVSWIFFRCLGLIVALILHLLATSLFATYLPNGLITYAPIIILAILVLMILTGSLKFIVGLILTTVDPLIAALYTFFFASLVGKKITRAVLTTGILACLVYALQKIGISTIYIASTVLMAYIPLIVLLVLLWYLVGKLL